MYSKAFNFIFSYISKNKKYLLLGMMGILMASLTIAPIPYLIGYILDSLIIETISNKKIFTVIILLMLLYLTNYIFILYYQHNFTVLQQKIVNTIRYELMKKIINANTETIYQYEKGYLLSRINEVYQISGLLSTNVLNCATGIFEFVFYLIIMFNMSKELTLAILLIIPCYYFLSKFLSKKTNENTIKMQESSAQLNGFIYETFQGLEDIKMLNAKKVQLKKIAKKIDDVIKKTIIFNMNLIKYIYGILFAGNIITVLILALSVYLIIKEKISIGIYTSFTIYMANILGITHSLASLDITIKPIAATIERLKELFAFEDESPFDCKFLEGNIENINFSNVAFKYQSNENFVLKGFSNSFKKGDKVLLTGSNGSGKTTLIKLILGLYKPIGGNIYINGIDYVTLNKDSIRARISIVSQNIFLFNCSVWENILYGSENKSKEDVIKIIDELNLSEYINQFDNGINTKIQNNNGISGGQKQIIALLRALIRDTDILILDEATTSLDTQTQKLVNQILDRIQLNKIQFTITHNIKSLKNINVQINMEDY